MNKESIKWAAVQPLTGGIYLGAENAIEHPAEFILSFRGLNDHRRDKENRVVGAGNEYHLTEYLKSHNRMPKYLVFDKRGMFDSSNDMQQVVVDENNDVVDITKYNLDLIVAVPICSGLSTVSTFNDEKKQEKNCNMRFITEYVLSQLSPKVYLFENAPALYTGKGTDLREWFNKIAENNGYNVTYFKTDTQLHKNCQHRPRTFVFFFKKRYDNDVPHVINFVNEHISATEYFKNIPKNLHYETAPWRYYSTIMMDFILQEYGDDWREKMNKKDLWSEVCHQNMFEKFREFTRTYDVLTEKQHASWIRKINDVEFKYNHNQGFFAFSPKMSLDTCPAVMFRNIENTIHPYENRLINLRENFELMGMPHDFRFGVDDEFAFRVAYQIGQNVPVKTAEYMVSEIVRILYDWETYDKNSSVLERNFIMLDNIKQRQDV